MSLEQAIKENTEAVKALTAALAARGNTPKPADTPPAKEKAPTAAPEAAAEAPSELTYKDIQKPFLKLVAKDRATAVALLGELGAKTLKEFEGEDTEQYAEVLAAIEEKLNG